MASQSEIQWARAIADRCADAYSADRYQSWRQCAVMLMRRGYTAREIEAILRSKWTRWAADSADRRDGKATAADLERFIRNQQPSPGNTVADLVEGTFGGG